MRLKLFLGHFMHYRINSAVLQLQILPAFLLGARITNPFFIRQISHNEDSHPFCSDNNETGVRVVLAFSINVL
jgi:hypothetical protein